MQSTGLFEQLPSLATDYEVYRSKGSNPLILYSEVDHFPLACLSFRAQFPSLENRTVLCEPDVAKTQPQRFQGLIQVNNQAIELGITNLSTEGWINFNLMFTDEQVRVTNPGGLNEINELKPFETYWVQSDQTKQDPKTKQTPRLLLKKIQVQVTDPNTHEQKTVDLTVAQDEAHQQERTTQGTYLYLSVAPEFGSVQLCERFAKTYWKVSDYLICPCRPPMPAFAGAIGSNNNLFGNNTMLGIQPRSTHALNSMVLENENRPSQNVFTTAFNGIRSALDRCVSNSTSAFGANLQSSSNINNTNGFAFEHTNHSTNHVGGTNSANAFSFEGNQGWSNTFGANVLNSTELHDHLQDRNEGHTSERDTNERHTRNPRQTIKRCLNVAKSSRHKSRHSGHSDARGGSAFESLQQSSSNHEDNEIFYEESMDSNSLPQESWQEQVQTSTAAAIAQGDYLTVNSTETGKTYNYELVSAPCVLGLSVDERLRFATVVFNKTTLNKEYIHQKLQEFRDLKLKNLKPKQIFASSCCTICQDDDDNAAPLDTIFYTCGHQCVHKECDRDKLVDCPLCRAQIVARLPAEKPKSSAQNRVHRKAGEEAPMEIDLD